MRSFPRAVVTADSARKYWVRPLPVWGKSSPTKVLAQERAGNCGTPLLRVSLPLGYTYFRLLELFQDVNSFSLQITK
eukprot:g53430.t1